MSDIIDIKNVTPEQAVADWLEAYRVLLKLEDGMGADYRRRLRNQYQKAKAILAAVLANAKNRRYIDAKGIYYLAPDMNGTSCYPAWLPHEATWPVAA